MKQDDPQCVSLRARRLLCLAMGAFCSVVAGCDDDGSMAPALDGGQTDVHVQADAGRTPVEIVFAARFGGRPFACGETYASVDRTGTAVTPADLRFYVQDVALVNAAGQAVPLQMAVQAPWQQDRVALLDFENKQGACGNGTQPTNDRIVGFAPAGVYRGLRFMIGVPFDLNHQPLTQSQPPLDLTALFWSWNMGHLFMKAEVAPVYAAGAADAGATDAGATDAGVDASGHHGGGDTPSVFGLHVGSTMCEGKASEGLLTACGKPNRSVIELPTFVPGQHRVVVDVAALFSSSDVRSEKSCHSFPNTPSCVGLFARVGLDYGSGAATPATQTVFKVE